ncbi:MAG TPA: MdtA/MuxA family multidrug efflux RND transporter periplasmic adaptor subunit [Bryobacteraceae bacterium]|jgi:multidrug efflux system membrane fusion protein|nr:MdtA/MuxA family multidrug efflux RND transporter periplasmic adaptor subunit [Bryobacteraceae bacterium]
MDPQTPSTLEPARPPASPEIRNPQPRSSSRLWFWLILVVLAGAAAYYFLPRLRQPQSGSASQAKGGMGRRGPMVIPVVTATAHKGDIGVYYTGLGLVTPIYTVTVKSRVDGQLMNVLYKEGQMVHAGDLLVEIDPRPYQVQLTQAEGQLLRDQALLQNARVDLARYETLWTQNAIPQQQLATQKALVSQYEGAIKTDQGQIDSAKLNITYCHITAPINGRIGLRLVDPGNIVHAGDSNGLLVITQIEPISVVFTLAQDQLPPVLRKMRAGQRLRVEAFDREMKEKLADGTLTTVDNQIDQTTGTLRLRAQFSNSNDALFPNQFVNARLLVEQKFGVTLISNGAIQRNSQSTYAWLIKPDQTVTVRQITTGTTEGDQTEITSGLGPGDVVVTEGVDKLQEGTKVNTRADQPAGSSRRKNARSKKDK